MNDNVIAMVKDLSRGPCSCSYQNGSFGIGWNPTTGKQTFSGDPGPKTECMRCRARRCLEADNVEYEKDDRAFWTLHNMGVKLNPATACKSFEGQVFVTSGTFMGGLK
jgi:hypothetical protein